MSQVRVEGLGVWMERVDVGISMFGIRGKGLLDRSNRWMTHSFSSSSTYQYDRGVHEISGLKPANGGVASFNRYSPTFLAGLLKPDQVH